MSEVVPLPSFGEVFFDARGQERCLRVTWHEGTLVLSLWRGEMCTASFRMPMDDVGRLLDTLDDGLAELQGEQAAPAEAPVIPGTGQYNRPPDPFPGVQPVADERPTATMSPSDVLVARGTPPPPPDKLVASFGESTGPGGYPAGSGYAEPMAASSSGDPVYQLPGESPQPQYRTDALGLPIAEPYSPPPMDGGYGQQPRYQQDPFAQQPSDPFGQAQPGPFGQPHSDPFAQQDRQGQADPFGRQQDPFGQQDPFAPATQPSYSGQPAHQGQGQGQQYGEAPVAPPAPGLGTPMHGIPGAGRRRQHPGTSSGTGGAGAAGGTGGTGGFGGGGTGGGPQTGPMSGHPLQTGPQPAVSPHHGQQHGQQQHGQHPQQHGGQHNGQPGAQHGQQLGGQSNGQPHGAQHPHQHNGQPHQAQPSPLDPLLALSTPQPDPQQPISRPYIPDEMFVTGERLRPDQQYDDRTW
ncbi:hypothetical protein ACIBG7_21925 [Nonomuraea sp. NPDC050328]|uniref:hypothetical protein n=1 Tax=Nonomuraea sp. NPDC050328 TaxID=3364361 RepID=UPI00379AA6D0